METQTKVDNEKVWAIYREIRRLENQNVKNQKYEDRNIVNKIVNYLEKIAVKELEKGEHSR